MHEEAGARDGSGCDDVFDDVRIGDADTLAIKHLRVDITIKDGVANARIEQVFKNSTDRDLEATYVFPLPENASIADFAMYMNGKRMSGELVEKGKARQVYEEIVRRMKDPGLLEHMGGNLGNPKRPTSAMTLSSSRACTSTYIR